MDWSNECYVRLYSRDTKTWKKLGWEGQAVLSLIMRKLDRAGLMDDVRDADDVAVMLANGMPTEIVEVGLSRLLREQVFMITEKGLLMPNFIEAQEAKKSDPQRQREARERKRALSRFVTDVNGIRSSETENRSPESQPVTACHSLSQPVTLTSADPVLCSALPSLPLHNRPGSQEVVVVDQKVPCPADLRLTQDQRGALETSMIPGWAIDEITNSFVASSIADKSDTRQLVHWRKCLAKAIASSWNDKRRRPRRPEPEQSLGSNGKPVMSAKDAGLPEFMR